MSYIGFFPPFDHLSKGGLNKKLKLKHGRCVLLMAYYFSEKYLTGISYMNLQILPPHFHFPPFLEMKNALGDGTKHRLRPQFRGKE